MTTIIHRKMLGMVKGINVQEQVRFSGPALVFILFDKFDKEVFIELTATR